MRVRVHYTGRNEEEKSVSLVWQTVRNNRCVLWGLGGGGGGMVEVYLARDKALGRDVALKVLRKQYSENRQFVERAEREAGSAAALSHPNIVSIYDRGESEDGACYIAMEYLPGGTLKDRISKSGALAPKTAAGVALQVAEALRAAHEKGVIHRGIKSQNVLFTQNGDVKVAGFGIAGAAATAVSRASFVLGSSAKYMSPEQAMGKSVGPTSELYSLGVVLYEMLTGEPPYDADVPSQIAMKHINEPPRHPGEVNTAVPESMDALTVKLLARNPEDRYPSAAELVEVLRRVREGLEETNTDGSWAAAAHGGGKKGRRWQSPRTLLAALIATLALLLGVVGLAQVSGGQEASVIRAQDVAPAGAASPSSTPANLSPEAPQPPDGGLDEGDKPAVEDQYN